MERYSPTDLALLAPAEMSEDVENDTKTTGGVMHRKRTLAPQDHSSDSERNSTTTATQRRTVSNVLSAATTQDGNVAQINGEEDVASFMDFVINASDKTPSDKFNSNDDKNKKQKTSALTTLAIAAASFRCIELTREDMVFSA